jgi:hypothetical protein
MTLPERAKHNQEVFFMFSKYAGVSLIALGLAMGGPALAQQPAQPGGPGQEPGAAAQQPAQPGGPGQQPGATTGPGQPGQLGAPGSGPERDALQQRVGFEDFMDKLGEIGIEDRELFAGTYVRSKTDEGHPMILLIGPSDFEAGEVAELSAEDFDDLRSQLTEAGFEDVQRDHEWLVIQGTLDGHYVLAGTGSADWRGEMDAAAGDIDLDAVKDKLGEIGVEDREELEGKLIRARAEDGGVMFVLVGPEGFAGGEEIDFDADELRDRFEEAGLTDAQVINEDLYLVRGSLDDHAVLALAGDGMFEGVEPTGIIQVPGQTPPAAAPMPSPGTGPTTPGTGAPTPGPGGAQGPAR